MSETENIIRRGATFALQSDYSEYRKRPQEMTGYSATGDYDEEHFCGTLVECQEEAGAQLALGTKTVQVETSLRRLDGGMAELTVRRSYYKADGGSAHGSGCGGGGSGASDSGSGITVLTTGAWGTSKARPTYEVHCAPTQESILTHPKITQYQGTIDETAQYCLKYIADGGGMWDIMQLPNQFQTSPADYLRANGYTELLDLVCKAPYFLDPGLELTVTWEVSKDSPEEGFAELCTIQRPEGPIKVKSPRNWLLVDATYRTQAGKTQCVKKYKLSGPNGWDPEIYGGGN